MRLIATELRNFLTFVALSESVKWAGMKGQQILQRQNGPLSAWHLLPLNKMFQFQVEGSLVDSRP